MNKKNIVLSFSLGIITSTHALLGMSYQESNRKMCESYTKAREASAACFEALKRDALEKLREAAQKKVICKKQVVSGKKKDKRWVIYVAPSGLEQQLVVGPDYVLDEEAIEREADRAAVLRYFYIELGVKVGIPLLAVMFVTFLKLVGLAS